MTPNFVFSVRPLLAAALPLLLNVGSAWAQSPPPSAPPPEIIKGDWRSVQIVDPQSLRVTCQTRTSVMSLVPAAPAQPIPVAGELSLSFAADAKNLPALQLRLPAETTNSSVALVRISSKESHLMFLVRAATDPAQFDVYQSAPLQLSTVLELIRSQNTLSVFLDAATPVPTLLRISLKGSSASLDQMQKCAGKNALLPMEFLKGLNTAVDLSNVSLSDISMVALIEATEKAYSASLAAGADNLALANLKKQFAKLLNEEKNARSAYNELQKNTDDLFATLQNRQTKLKSLTDEVAKLQADRPGTVAQIETLKQIEVEKLAIYEPLRKQLAPLDAEVERQEDRVSDARHDLSSARQDVATGESRLSQLRSRLSSARHELSSDESRERSLERDLNRAEWELRRYDIDRERRDYLDRNFNYRNAINQRNSAQSSLPSAQSNLSSAQGTLSSLQSQLSSCQATAGADCSALQGQVNNQSGIVQQAAAQVQQLQTTLNEANNTISQEERQADWSARSGQQNLLRRRNDIANNLSQIQRNISNLESEIRNIDFEIPRTESDIRSAEARVRSAQGYLGDAQNKLAAAIEARDNLRGQLDWARIRGEYMTAKSTRETAQSNLAKADQRVKELPSFIKAQTDSVASAQKRYDASLPPRDAALNKLNALTAQLAAYYKTESEILVRLASAKATFDTNRTQYQALYQALKVL
ncbi:MAG: hypothetical protein ACK5P7_11100 [Bdellovibrio sp.]|jgi:predicted  nucleic acid-binding Zn-ribbon protein